jgi:hypothetical protein
MTVYKAACGVCLHTAAHQADLHNISAQSIPVLSFRHAHLWQMVTWFHAKHPIVSFVGWLLLLSLHCRTVSVLQAAGCPVQLQVLPGKGHFMINSEPEMRACMTFWAKHLKQRPADPDYVEVE